MRGIETHSKVTPLSSLTYWQTQARIDAYWKSMQDLFAKGAVGEAAQSAYQTARQRIDNGDF